MGGEWAFDVTEADFAQRVLKAPADSVVVVDFWAPWCEPCRELGPILEKVVSSSDGTAILAKVNVDENPRLADSYQVVGIPAVKVFRHGQVVAEFVGAYQEDEVRELLRPVLPSKADRFVSDADALMKAGGGAMVQELYEQALKLEPHHAGATVGLAQISLEQEDIDRAEALLKTIGEDAPEYDPAYGLLGRVELARRCQAKGGPKACAERLAGDPKNLDARFDNASCLAAAGKYQEALAEFLLVLEENKDYGSGAAKDAMVRILPLLGPQNPVAAEYRRRLASVLY